MTFEYAKIVEVGARGATLKVAGVTTVTSWQALREAADQDAAHHGRPVDDETRALAERYRGILGAAYKQYREQAAKAGRLLTLCKFMIGQQFGTEWGLAYDHDRAHCLVRTGTDAFGSSAGISYLQKWADEHGYAI